MEDGNGVGHEELNICSSDKYVHVVNFIKVKLHI